MALVPCPECKKDVSSTAAACPTCGALVHAPVQGRSAADDRNACPICGKTLPTKALICIDCNVNVKTGESLYLPSLDQARPSSPGTALVFVFAITASAVLGYWQRGPIHELLVEYGMAKAEGNGVETTQGPQPPIPDGIGHTASETGEPRDDSAEETQARVEAPAEPAGAPTVRESAPATPAEQPATEHQTEGSVLVQSAPHPPAPARQPTQAARSAPAAKQPQLEIQTIRITCPLCRGEGRLAEDDSQRWTYQCPVCIGRANRDLRIASDHRVCAKCSGMRRVARLDDFRKTNKHYVADRCDDCGGAGIR